MLRSTLGSFATLLLAASMLDAQTPAFEVPTSSVSLPRRRTASTTSGLSALPPSASRIARHSTPKVPKTRS